MVCLRAIALGALVTAMTVPALATTRIVSTDSGDAAYGMWHTLNVNDLDAQSRGIDWIDNENSLSPLFGSPLRFSFTIGSGDRGTLTVVDAGFAGDTFRVNNWDLLLGNTSPVAMRTYDQISMDPTLDVGTDFDAALANSDFSRGAFTLAAGSYLITGTLLQSVGLDEATPLNSTVGAIRLTVSPVPEPTSMAMMLAGLILFGTMARRRR